MTPAARLQAVIDILEEFESSPFPADRFIRDWFRRRRYAGSKDRAAVAEHVFDVLRHRGFLAWWMRSEAPRALVIGTLLRDGGDLESIRTLFSVEGYGPAALMDEEVLSIGSPPLGDPPLHVQGGFPQWLEPELTRSFGTDLLDQMITLQGRAAIDLRVNRIKANRNDVLIALRGDGFRAKPMPFSPVGIRIPPGEGTAALGKSKLFQSGAFEFQDEAAQIASLLVDAQPNIRVLDLAAGGGGKALAIAAAMQNTGEILAVDDNPSRLKPLAERAARAGATNITIAEKRGGALWGDGKFDRVLVDAPCSGTGTWRRQPELRWRLAPERLESLEKTQDWLLDDGARHTKPGGRLVYATCSLLPCENEDRIEAFLARHPNFAGVPARAVWSEAVGTEPPRGLSQFFRASPLSTGTDGFFTAILECKA